ncbi:MAG: sigma-70 family RNA polymerase sigma factor [Phycisphaerales bacterium]|jgi:RNA polymerase sigma-70 factor (ECF subfamily)
MNTNMEPLSLRLLHQAQQGCQDSLSNVTVLTRERVYLYLLRVTLNYHVADDVAQETSLSLIKLLPQRTFTNIPSYWAWIFKTTNGKLHGYFRKQAKALHPSLNNADTLPDVISSNESEPTVRILRSEKSRILYEAITQLRTEYRTVLTLRCLEKLSYPRIAAVMGGSQMRAKMLFYRAKVALRRQLTRQGLGRSDMLSAIIVFGKLTAGTVKKSQVAITVHPAAFAVTWPTVVCGVVLSKAGILATVVVVLLGFHADRISNLVSSILPATNQEQSDPYTVLVNPNRVINTSDAGQNGWRQYILPGPMLSAQRTTPEIMLIYRPENLSVLLVPQQQWIHVGFAAPLVDGPGVDIFMEALRTEGAPRFWITDGLDQELEIKPSEIIIQRDFIWREFDLQGLDLPFVPQGIRVEGYGTANANDCLGIWIIKARIQP